jgi:hypothetical protein
MKTFFKSVICLVWWALALCVWYQLIMMLRIPVPNDGDLVLMYKHALFAYMSTGLIALISAVWITIRCFNKNTGQKNPPKP